MLLESIKRVHNASAVSTCFRYDSDFNPGGGQRPAQSIERSCTWAAGARGVVNCVKTGKWILRIIGGALHNIMFSGILTAVRIPLILLFLDGVEEDLERNIYIFATFMRGKPSIKKKGTYCGQIKFAVVK
ncbi:MAG: hypothetical protein ACLT3H_05210 [Roseburia sp.]